MRTTRLTTRNSFCFFRPTQNQATVSRFCSCGCHFFLVYGFVCCRIRRYFCESDCPALFLAKSVKQELRIVTSLVFSSAHCDWNLTVKMIISHPLTGAVKALAVMTGEEVVWPQYIETPDPSKEFEQGTTIWLSALSLCLNTVFLF